MAEPLTELESAGTADALTEDRWLGGRLLLVQPKRGHRVGTDAALLVAAAGDARQGRIVDVGAGVGAVGLAFAQRSSLASVDLVELDPELAALAESNAARNGLQSRTRVLRLDALNPRERREAGLAESAELRRHQPAILRRQDGPRLSRRRQSASACLAGAGARSPTGYGLRSRFSRRAGGS